MEVWSPEGVASRPPLRDPFETKEIALIAVLMVFFQSDPTAAPQEVIHAETGVPRASCHQAEYAHSKNTDELRMRKEQRSET